jgi:hypothetical protein
LYGIRTLASYSINYTVPVPVGPMSIRVRHFVVDVDEH